MQDEKTVGVGVAMGIVVGSVLFVLTDSAVWLGVGIAVGAAIGANWGRIKRS